MSYDLMVFDLKAAPSEPRAFLLWYDEVTKWGEGHSYDDPDICGPELQAWFHRMIETFPAMNGPYAVESEDSAITDYSIAKDAIYVAFSWSAVERAYNETTRLASECRLGFYDVSGPKGSLWRPNESMAYEETVTAGLAPKSDVAEKLKGEEAQSVEDYMASLFKDRDAN